MSGVLLRFRKKSTLKVLNIARDMQGKVLNWGCENIPKKKRNIFLPSLKNITHEIVENIRFAENSYPEKEGDQNYIDRVAHIHSARYECSNLWHELQAIDDTLLQTDSIDLSKMEDFLKEILEINEKLKKWEENPMPSKKENNKNNKEDDKK